MAFSTNYWITLQIVIACKVICLLLYLLKIYLKVNWLLVVVVFPVSYVSDIDLNLFFFLLFKHVYSVLVGYTHNFVCWEKFKKLMCSGFASSDPAISAGSDILQRRSYSLDKTTDCRNITRPFALQPTSFPIPSQTLSSKTKTITNMYLSLNYSLGQ